MNKFRPVISLIVCVFLAFSFCYCQSKAPASSIYAFTNVHVLPMNQEGVLENQTVIIKKGKIYKIGPAKKVKVPRKAIKIDGEGKYLMPGLAEMHAHIPVPQDGDDELVQETLFLYLSNGVTTIRGMLGDPYHLSLKKKIAAGNILSPRVYTSSPSMNGNTVSSKLEAIEKVTQYQQDGYDFLKIHPGIKKDVFDELVATANKVGIPFSGHVPADVGVHHALESRYASIDHLDGYIDGLVPKEHEIDRTKGGFFGYNFTSLTDEAEIAALAKKTKSYGVWIVPTQSLFTRWFSPQDGAAIAAEPEMKYMSPKTLFAWRQSHQSLINNESYSAETYQVFLQRRQALLRGLHKAGVNLLLGSDAPQVFNVPGFSLQHEMKAMSEAGLSNFTILHSGTVNPARFFKSEGSYGTIVKGASADLILLSANPLEDIENMQEQLGVMVRGEWLSKAMIDEKLAAIAKKYSE